MIINKRLLLVSILILSFCSVSYALKVENSFRNITWGMSKEEILKVESGMKFEKKELGEKNLIRSKTRLAGLKCFLIYTFVRDKLVGAAYLFDEIYQDKSDYQDDFDTLKELLIQKYGELESEDLVDKDAFYFMVDSNTENYIHRITWKTNDTEIALFIDKSASEIDVFITYDSIELMEWAEKILLEEDLEKL
ncbi:unnamed protein product [marine sediment metagenome]|uniref:Uncharacterized protein n=1 Tax=marine sediment metagenome TaxID=412755 RepID=X1I2E2_9ZZZZ